MTKYVRLDDVLDYADGIRPYDSDYFNVGIAEEMRLDKEKEIADELEQLPFVELPDESDFGYWLDDGSLSARCYACGCKTTDAKNYCPVCGARNKHRDDHKSLT